jgi:hypothetical protein
MPFDKGVSPRLANLDLADLLDRVIIGPTQFGSVIKTAFIDALEKMGVPSPEKRIYSSHLPLRS